MLDLMFALSQRLHAQTSKGLTLGLAHQALLRLACDASWSTPYC